MPDYGPLYQTAGQAWNIDPLLLQAMAGKESNETPSATNPKSGAQGMMQFLPTTAPEYGVRDPYNAQQSVIGAARYMDTLLKKHNGDLSAALADYSGNAGNPNAPYVKDVTGRYTALQQGWGTTAPAANPPGTSSPAPIIDVTNKAGFGTKFGKFADNGVPQGMIIHHTAGRGSVDSVLNTYKSTNFPAPFIIDRDGNIYQAIPDGYQGQHIKNGTGPVGEGKSNANMEGVEIIANDDKDVLPVQQQAAANLLQQRADRWGWVNPQALVYGHGEVNPGHKEPTEGMTVAGGVRNGTLQLPSFAGSPPQEVQVASNSKTTQATATDFDAMLSGKTTPAAKPAPAPAKTDFDATLMGAPAAASGAPTAPEPVSGIPEAGQPPAAQPAPAPRDYTPVDTQPAAQEIEGTPITPPQPRSWLQANIIDPLRQAYNPLTQAPPMNYLMGSPGAQEIAAGVLQGPRNVATVMNNFERYMDQRFPWLAALDKSAAKTDIPVVSPLLTGPLGATPQDLEASRQRLAAETKANQLMHGGTLPYMGGEVAGDVLATYPLALAGTALVRGAEMVPQIPQIVRNALPFANTVLQGGGSNVLTNPNEAPGKAFEEGGAGALLLHGLLGSVGDQFARGTSSQAVQEGRDLGFKFTTGEERGGLAKQLEDVTQYAPGSGAAQKAAEHRSVINSVLNRNMGVAGDKTTQATLQTARANAGNLMNQINTVTVDVNKDPKLLSELAEIAADAKAQPTTGTSITSLIDKIQDTAANTGTAAAPKASGTLPGGYMHDLYSQGTPLDRLVNSPDPVIRQFAERVKTSLQDAQSRTGDAAIYGTTQAAANQAAVDAFNRGRYFWKTIKTVEPLVDKTGSADDATYLALANRIQKNFDPRYAGAEQDMQKLARVLKGPLEEMKSSGTGRQLLTAGGLLAAGQGLAKWGPETFNQYLEMVAPYLAMVAPGRLSRFGPGLGIPALEAANQVFNPLVPRVAGPTAYRAANQLLAPPQGQQ